MQFKRFVVFLVVQSLLAGALSAAEPRVLFHDAFDEKLGDGWSWLRENEHNWRIREGALEIRVEPGKADNVKNALVRKAPDRAKSKFAVEVTIASTTDPTEQFEQAGVTWYCHNKPVLKIVHEHIDGENWIIPGRKPAPKRTVQLRLVVDGRQWTAQFREDLKGKFQTTETGRLPPPGNDQISLQCYEGPADEEHWMRFDDFRIVELPD